MSKLVLCAKIVGVVGLKGHVAVKTFFSDENNFLACPHFFINETDCLKVDREKTINRGKKGFSIKFFDTNSREEAEKLKNLDLFVDRSTFPEVEAGEYYYEDMINSIILVEGLGQIGQVIDVKNFGAGDIIEIELNHSSCSGRYMVPFNCECIEKEEIPEKIWLSNFAFEQYCLKMR